MAKRTKKAGVLSVDFSNVKEGGGGVRMPENDYHLKIASVKEDISEKSGNPMLVIQFGFVDKKAAKKAGGTIRENFVLQEKSLWKLRDLLEAVGVKVPKRTVQIPIKKLVGKELGGTIVDDEPYNGRIKSKIADYMTLDDFESGAVDDEDEEDLDDDTDDDDDDEADLDGMDRSELKAYIKEQELDVTVKRSMSDDDIREAIQEEEGDDEDSDDDDDDDEDIEDLDLDDL